MYFFAHFAMNCIGSCFTVASDPAAHGIVVRHLRFKYYLNRALVFVDPYIHAEYKTVSKSERCGHMRLVCCFVLVLGIVNILNLFLTRVYQDTSWERFRYGVAIAIAVWSLFGSIVTFTKFIYNADMPVIWHIGNMVIMILNLAETDHTFTADLKPSFFISEASVFLLVLSSAYAILTILIVPFWVNALSLTCIQGALIWFYVHLQSQANKIPVIQDYSCGRALSASLFCSFCILTLAYIREREKCSDFILRRIRSNKDMPRNLEAGVYVGALLEQHLGSDLAIIQNNRPSESSDENKNEDQADGEENRAVEVDDSVDEFGCGSSMAEPREKLPTAPSPSVRSAGESIFGAAKALIPSVYQKSEDCGSVQC